MKPFDLIDSSLEGTHLIEASAGTGKTYTITGLFLRLILEKQLRVDQILVVTYTNSATAELKERIRSKLLDTRQAFHTKETNGDRLIGNLLKRFDDSAVPLRLLQEALTNFDHAQIFTIHGFCQRILVDNAFETGNLFDTELVTDQTSLWEEISDDYWRTRLYEAPLEVVGYAVDRFKGPAYFYDLMNMARIPGLTIVPDVQASGFAHLEPFREIFRKLKGEWPGAKDAVTSVLNSAALNGTVYGTLKKDPTHPDYTKREIKTLSMIAEMDRYLWGGKSGFPLFPGFDRFTSVKLARSTPKKQIPPTHRIFDLCQELHDRACELQEEIDTRLLFLRRDFFSFAQVELEKRKRNKNIQFFDDLLIRVQHALDRVRTDDLADAIRKKYGAALIDEFQDTDAVQYDIFSKLFSSDQGTLFLIGDPKQAIYAFRGADVFSYLKASRQADRKHTLVENYRSSPELIAAVNTLFSGVKHPFLFDEISFQKGMPASADDIPDSNRETSPMTLWYLLPEMVSSSDRPVGKNIAVPLIAQAVAAEISRLMSPGPEGHAPAVKGNQICVLVRTNRQAQVIKSYLSGLSVPSVLYSSGNIFDTREAAEMVRILTGISDPANDRRFRSALATDFMGVVGDTLDCNAMASRWWDGRLARFQEYFHLWKNLGFIRMFRALMQNEKVKERIVALSDGERRLTNILHLSEILHQASLEENLGMTGLIKWLSDKMDPGTPRREEHQLRLESDALSVKIVTIHKSKGLEYDIVFCPFGWEGLRKPGQGALFHDDSEERRLILDLDPGDHGESIVRSQREELAENLRLFYVALTRAKTMCYVVWGRVNGAETSALAHLFYGNGLGEDDVSVVDPVEALSRRFAGIDSDAFMTDLNRLARRAKGTIGLAPIALDPGREYVPFHEAPDDLCRQTFSAPIDTDWKISSYSSIISRYGGAPDYGADPELPDYDAVGTSETKITAEQDDREGMDDLFCFPKGARAGLFFHDILEHCDFSQEPDKALVIQKLDEYGFEEKWSEPVCALIDTVSGIRMMGPDNDFTLSQLKGFSRVNELEFYYPIRQITAGAIRDIFAGDEVSSIPDKFLQRLGPLTFRASGGFMKGFIDMVFEHEGRFYLVDWKSNYLGSRTEDYDSASLTETMAAEYYILQYHIYALALHQYLEIRVPGYQYASDFGGIFYIFLRGLDLEKGASYGIYRDTPKVHVIESLGKRLIPGFTV
jgi:exodeoxyribonuclease V beta subunit